MFICKISRANTLSRETCKLCLLDYTWFRVHMNKNEHFMLLWRNIGKQVKMEARWPVNQFHQTVAIASNDQKRTRCLLKCMSFMTETGLTAEEIKTCLCVDADVFFKILCSSSSAANQGRPERFSVPAASEP